MLVIFSTKQQQQIKRPGYLTKLIHFAIVALIFIDNCHGLQTLKNINSAQSSQKHLFAAPRGVTTPAYFGGSYTLSADNAAAPPTRHKVLAIPGDIIFGGLFPIHEQDTVKGCGKIDPERGIQRLEAMLFTLDKINFNFSYLLPGIRLGALVMDTCGSDYIALERSLEIVQTAAVTDGAASSSGGRGGRDYTSCLRQTQQQDPDMRIGLGLMPGLIGAASSTESIQVASLFRLFRIPMISYASTSAELSDKKRYEFFARTVPSDIFQSKAVTDILLAFDWTYVSVIYSDGDYGSSLFEAFLRRAGLNGICIAHVGKLTKRGEMNEFREHVRALLEKEKARVVVLFIAAKDVRQFLKAVALEIGADQLPYFQFVASDGWGTQKALLSDSDASLASEGAITLEIKTAPLPGFDDYFKKLMTNPETNLRNPWFKEFCEANRLARQQQTYMLSTQGIRDFYEGPSCMTEDYQQDSKNIFVHNAVYAFALALRKLQQRHCGMKHTGLCDQMVQNLQAVNVYKTILNVTFKDPIGRSVKFDDFGDAVGHYNIYKYRRQTGPVGGIGGPLSTFSQRYYNVTTASAIAASAASAYRFQYDHVGEWNGRLQIPRSMRLVVPVINQTKVKSKCSEQCTTGQAMRIMIKGCCWECVNCAPFQIVGINASQCVDCEPGYWPDESRMNCIKLKETHLDMLSWYVILSAVIASLGIIITTIAIVVYVKFLDTPLVKASSVELSFIILAGCFVTFLTTFFYLSWPSLPICIIRRLSFGLGIASIYSAVAVKINRIFRIFEAATKSSQQPPMISPESQLMLVACFIGIQLALSVVSLLFDPPDVSDFNPSGDRLNWYKTCATTARSYSLLMALTIILIIGATYYAIRTRNCPEPYREARVVGFSVYTTFIIWLAFVPLFFTTSSSVELQTTVICISLSLCGWVVLACLFARRIYIIVFQPDKNVKPGKFTLSAAVSRNAHIVTKLALHPANVVENNPPGPLQHSSSNQPQQTRLSVTADEDSNTNTTATRALMLESAATLAIGSGDHYGSTATSLAQTSGGPPQKISHSPSNITTTANVNKQQVEMTTLVEPSNTTKTQQDINETIIVIQQNPPALLSPAPSLAINKKSDPTNETTTTRKTEPSEPEQEPLLPAQGKTNRRSASFDSQSEENSKDDSGQKLSNVSRESSEILDEIRSTSTSSYNLLRKDCFVNEHHFNDNAKLIDQIFDQNVLDDNTSVMKSSVKVIGGDLLVGAANRYAIAAETGSSGRQQLVLQKTPVAPIASISSITSSSNNLPPGDRISLASYATTDSYYDSTVIDGNLIPNDMPALIIAQKAGARTVVDNSDEDTTTKAGAGSTTTGSGSQDDIASILERHEQLTTILKKGRVIAICNEAVINL